MTSNSTTVPLHESVGNDPNNWTTLSDKEAKVRAKAIEKGHTPHDWRWAFNKVFKTNKAYPETLRPAAEATNNSNVPSHNQDVNRGPTTSRSHQADNTPLVSGNTGTRQESGHFSNTHASDASHAHHTVDTPLGSNLLGRERGNDRITAPENAPEMAGGRDQPSEPKIQTNIVA